MLVINPFPLKTHITKIDYISKKYDEVALHLKQDSLKKIT